MYKSQLHNLCQQKAWPRPNYSVSRTGPDHDSRFQATVTVNGLEFTGIDVSKSSKEAQNKISQVALNHFVSSPPGSSPHEVSQVAFNHFASGPPGSSPPTIVAGSKLSCTSQLQAYAKKYLPRLPVYTYACQGPDHALRYKAEVIVGGRTFRSRILFKTLKEAENDAAKTALLHLPSKETNNTQDDSISYTALLDELAQRAGMKMPVYKTGSNGASYMPVFTSVVDVGNSGFFGKVAKSKMQAEMNAAKVAWLKLNEGNNANSGKASHLPNSPEHVPFISQSAVSKNVKQSHATENHCEGYSDNKGENEVAVQNDSGLSASSQKIQQDATKQNKFNGNNTSPSEPLPAQQSADTIPEIVSACHVRPANSSLHYNRVRVYPRKDGMVLPEGVNLLTLSDAKWVAVSLDSPSTEGNDANSGKASHLPDSIEHVPLNSQSAVSMEQSQATKNHHGRILDNKGENEISVQNDSGFSESSLKNQIDTTEQNKFNGIDISPSALLPAQEAADTVPQIFSACHIRFVNSSLLYNRVRVYPRKDDLVLPEGVTLLPFSDANWVAVSLDSNFEERTILKLLKSLRDRTLHSSLESDAAEISISDNNSESLKCNGTCASFCNRVAVHSNKPDTIIPDDVEMSDVGEGHSKSLLKPTGRIGKMKKKQHLNKGRRCGQANIGESINNY